MPKVRLPVSTLNMDLGPSPGGHLWVARDVILSTGGLEMTPSWVSYANATLTSGYLPRGVGTWRGGSTGRVYIGTDNKLWELGSGALTDVTGNAMDNVTNGVTFANYGEWMFASNGVDEIQVMKVPSALAASTNFKDMAYTTGGAKIAPKYICSHKNHIVGANIKFLESYGTIASYTTAAGAAFTNQPNGSGSLLQVISSSGVDVGQSVSIYGTTTGGGDTVTSDTIVTNGTSAVDGTISTFQKILGVYFTGGAAATGTITIRNKTGATTITTVAPAGTSSGVYLVAAADQGGGDRVIDIVASGATTRQVGFIGTDTDGSTLFDSQALSGTTIVQSNSEFRSVFLVLTGDIENTRTVTVSSHQYPVGYTDSYLVWWSGTDDPEGYGTEVLAPQIAGSSNQPLLDGIGKVTGVVDGGDCFFVFKAGCVYRFDGPPFQATNISASVGMAAGNVPYKQNDRIYFWSTAGLRYIDIKTNQIEKPADGTAQKAVTGGGIGVYNGIDYQYPKSRTSPMELANGLCTGSVVSISGDPANSMVFVLYYNGSGVSGADHGLAYDEVADRFTQITGPSGSNAVGTYLVELRTDSGGETFPPGGNLKCIYKTTATNMRVDSFTRVGFTSTTSARDAYIRWPFWSDDQNGSSVPTRVVRVRPVFDNLSTFTQGNAWSVKVEVVSVSGTQKSWYLNGVLSTGQTTASLDGWVSVDGCPVSDKHSIGVSINGTKGVAAVPNYMSNFIGIDVEYVLGPLKSM